MDLKRKWLGPFYNCWKEFLTHSRRLLKQTFLLMKGRGQCHDPFSDHIRKRFTQRSPRGTNINTTDCQGGNPEAREIILIIIPVV